VRPAPAPLAPLALLILGAAAAHAADLLAKYDFEPGPASAPPLLEGWSANDGTKGYKPAGGWKKPIAVALDPACSHSGEDALRFAVAEEAPREKTLLSPAIAVPAPGPIRIRCYARGEKLAPGSVEIRVLEKDAQGKVLRWLGEKPLFLTLQGGDAWEEAERVTPSGPQTRMLMIQFVLKNAPASATLWIDDLSVELLSPDGTDATPIDPTPPTS